MENVAYEVAGDNYFKQVVKDAIKGLTDKKRKHKTAYVFSQEQVDEIKKHKGLENIKVRKDDFIYLLSIDEQ